MFPNPAPRAFGGGAAPVAAWNLLLEPVPAFAGYFSQAPALVVQPCPGEDTKDPRGMVLQEGLVTRGPRGATHDAQPRQPREAPMGSFKAQENVNPMAAPRVPDGNLLEPFGPRALGPQGAPMQPPEGPRDPKEHTYVRLFF